MQLLARTGDSARSQKIADDLVHQYPNDTVLNKVFVPLALATSDLQRNQPAEAVAALEIAAPTNLAPTLGPRITGSTTFAVKPSWVRNRAQRRRPSTRRFSTTAGLPLWM